MPVKAVKTKPPAPAKAATAVTASWKKGRGKLGPLAPLLGSWKAEADSPMGRIKCFRTFTSVLGGNYVELNARWEMPGGRVYEEAAIYGAGGAGQKGTLRFWSFTSDGKRSEGELADVADVHPEGVGFVAEMPAGQARMIYWPSPGGFSWAVEARTKKGWSRFTEHHYVPVPSPFRI